MNFLGLKCHQELKGISAQKFDMNKQPLQRVQKYRITNTVSWLQSGL